MCGISGIIGEKATEENMGDCIHAISHRGPDEQGIWKDYNIVLGHKRLSIIDLESGQQPMISNSGRWILVYNGEIYNFLELKKTRYSDYNYKTNSDTEVVLAGLEVDGTKCFENFNGMFAIAAWNTEEKKLYLAKDSFGIKPLYYTFDKANNHFSFSSEVKGMLCFPIDYRASISSIETYFNLRFVPPTKTVFENVYKLFPGHFMEVDETGNFSEQKVFKFKAPEIENGKSKNQWLNQLDTTLNKAIKNQLISDVPVGVLLSGGVDSALVTAIAKKHLDTINTFCVGYEDNHWSNEFEEARETSRFLGTDHHELYISMDKAIESMPKIIKHLEEPIVTTSVFSYFLLTEQVAKHRKVVLTGQGVDEPWGGYRRHKIMKILSVFPFLSKLNSKQLMKLVTSEDNANRMVSVLSAKNELEKIVQLNSVFPNQEIDKLFKNPINKKGFAQQLLRYYLKFLPENGTSFERVLAADTRLSLPENLLMLGDKLSMAHSLEVRVPFLDHEYMNLVERMPGGLRVKGVTNITTKYLHKEIAKKYLNDEIIYRKKKGFLTPIDEWLKGELGNHISDIISNDNSFTKSYLNIDYVHSLIETHRKGGQGNLDRQLFSIWAIEEWFKVFIVNPKTNNHIII